jgi:hypothetical protein
MKAVISLVPCFLFYVALFDEKATHILYHNNPWRPCLSATGIGHRARWIEALLGLAARLGEAPRLLQCMHAASVHRLVLEP